MEDMIFTLADWKDAVVLSGAEQATGWVYPASTEAMGTEIPDHPALRNMRDGYLVYDVQLLHTERFDGLNTYVVSIRMTNEEYVIAFQYTEPNILITLGRTVYNIIDSMKLGKLLCTEQSITA